MNFIKKIFGADRKKNRTEFFELLRQGTFSEEEIIRFKIVRLEILIAKEKETLKELLKPKKKK